MENNQFVKKQLKPEEILSKWKDDSPLYERHAIAAMCEYATQQTAIKDQKIKELEIELENTNKELTQMRRLVKEMALWNLF